MVENVGGLLGINAYLFCSSSGFLRAIGIRREGHTRNKRFTLYDCISDDHTRHATTYRENSTYK